MQYFDVLPKPIREALNKYGFDPSQVYRDWSYNDYDTELVLMNIHQVASLYGMTRKGY